MPGRGGEVGALPAIPAWMNAVVIVGTLLMASGAVIALVRPAMLVSPHDAINGAVRVYADYLFTRNLPMALLMLALLAMGARRALGNLLALVGIVQLMDAVVDCVEARWIVAAGVLVLGVLFLMASARLCGGAFWKGEAWLR